MSLDNTSYISVPERIIAQFSDTGPESYDFATPVLNRTRRSTLILVFSFSANPGNYDLGITASIDGIEFYDLDAITGSGITSFTKIYPNFTAKWIQPFQNSKDNNVVLTITAQLV